MKKTGTVAVVASSVALAGLVLVAMARPSAADAPAGRFMVSAGTVIDTQTGLTWAQAVPATRYTFAAAGTYCTNNTAGLPNFGWRLPSLTEIQTLVDDSRSGPAIDPTAFPNTPITDFYWTSSPYAPTTGSVWISDFSAGLTYSESNLQEDYFVRCVR
jgi:hypothetical protein